MTKILTTIAAATFLMSGAAFAQESGAGNDGALNAPGVQFETGGLEQDNEALFEFWADEEGMMREDDDFEARVAEASDDDRAALNNMCTEMQEDEALYTDTVQTRCKMIYDMQ